MNDMNDPTAVFRGCVMPDGQRFDAKPDQSLFKSMQQANIKWPVSCRNGTCRTCIARLLEGQVSYEIEWPGLSADEKREGWILPCVARPLCDVVLQDPLSE